MKRAAYDDSRDDQRAKLHRPYEGSPLSSTTDSPVWRAPSESPAYRPQPRNKRSYKGCSRITDYEFLDKLGEGTFG